MEDFPGNSHLAKSERSDDPKKIDPVVTGAVRRKKPLSRRFGEAFFGGDIKSATAFVIHVVLVPAMKDTLSEALSQGFERVLFGETRAPRSRSGTRYSGSNGYVSYDRYGTSRGVSRGSAPPWDREGSYRSMTRRGKATHNFDEILMASRPEAETVLSRMYDLLERYEVVSVSDLYELVGENADYTDTKWGWVSLQGSSVTRVSEGFLLDLPKPEPIN